MDKTKMIGVGYFKRFLTQKRDAALRQAGGYDIMSEAWAIWTTKADVYAEILDKIPDFFGEDG